MAEANRKVVDPFLGDSFVYQLQHLLKGWKIWCGKICIEFCRCYIAIKTIWDPIDHYCCKQKEHVIRKDMRHSLQHFNQTMLLYHQLSAAKTLDSLWIQVVVE